MSVLSHLYLHPAQRPHQLMAVTGLSRPSVAAIVVRLERLGLLQRAFGEHDRRTTLASLTRSGRRRMSELDGAMEEHFAMRSALASEILDLLGRVAPGPSNDRAPERAIALIGRLTEARATYDTRLDGVALSLPPRQQLAISTLMSWGLSRSTHLAEALHLSSGGLTYVIDQLESEGIVTRTYGSADDPRAVFVQLSEKAWSTDG